MGYTLTYRSSEPLTPQREAAIRLAADSFNQGRSWVLTISRHDSDGRLTCAWNLAIRPTRMPTVGKGVSGPAPTRPRYCSKAFAESLATAASTGRFSIHTACVRSASFGAVCAIRTRGTTPKPCESGRGAAPKPERLRKISRASKWAGGMDACSWSPNTVAQCSERGTRNDSFGSDTSP